MVLDFNSSFGLIGAIILILAWLPEIHSIVRNGKSNLEIKFSILYVIASIFLVLHAIWLHDIVFIIVNSAVVLIGLINLHYGLKEVNWNKMFSWEKQLFPHAFELKKAALAPSPKHVQHIFPHHAYKKISQEELNEWMPSKPEPNKIQKKKRKK